MSKVDKSTRNDEIVRRHVAGESLPSIAIYCGICTEQVRRIVASAGQLGRRSLDKLNWHAVINDAVARQMTAREVALERGCTTAAVYANAHKVGVVLEKRSAAKLASLKRGADLVLSGESNSTAALMVGVSKTALLVYCNQAGVKSQFKSRSSHYAEGRS